jgi:hypothetical protein
MKAYMNNCKNKTGNSESEPSCPGERTLKNCKNKTGLFSVRGLYKPTCPGVKNFKDGRNKTGLFAL